MTARKSARFRVGQCLSPYPVRYSRAFAFSALLYPPRRQRSLRFACRCRQRDVLTLFRMNFRAGRTLPIRRPLVVHGGPVHEDHSTPRTVLVQACQHVWLANGDDVYRKFTYVGRTRSSLAPFRLRAGRFRLTSRFGVPVIRRVYVVPRASHQAVAAQHVRVGNG
jgi:hypothetical protein